MIFLKCKIRFIYVGYSGYAGYAEHAVFVEYAKYAKGAHPCTSSSEQGGCKRVLEAFF